MPTCLKKQPLRRTLFRVFCVTCAAVGVFAAAGVSHPVTALADVPAFTDFGQDSAQPTMKLRTAAQTKHSHALFVTLYADGHGQVEDRPVKNDAVASFAAEHPVWKLDQSLMWFMQMPVYVKRVADERIPFAEQEAV